MHPSCLVTSVTALWNVACVASLLPCTGSPEDYSTPNGKDYRGFVNVTQGGYACQAWGAQFPQQHPPIAPDLMDGITASSNYCRNPFGDSAPGCFTTNPSVRYDQCNVGPPCTRGPLPDHTVVIRPSNGTVYDDTPISIVS